MDDEPVARQEHPEGRALARGQGMSLEEAASLYALRTAWDGVYDISLSGSRWRAVPAVEVAGVITADSAAGLRRSVQDDYAARAERGRELQHAARALHRASTLLAEGHQPQLMTSDQVRHLLGRYQRHLSELVRSVGGPQ